MEPRRPGSQLPLHFHVHIADKQAFRRSTYQNLMLLRFVNYRDEFIFDLPVQVYTLKYIHCRHIQVQPLGSPYPKAITGVYRQAAYFTFGKSTVSFVNKRLDTVGFQVEFIQSACRTNPQIAVVIFG